MGNDPIIALAHEARLNPNHVIANLGELSPAERVRILVRAARDYHHEPYRQYTPDPEESVRQLVASEYMSPKADRRWDKFYISKNANGNLFHRQYLDMWTQVDAIGEIDFFSDPRMLTYVLQSVSTAENPASLLRSTSIKSRSRQKNMSVPGLGKIPLFVCGAMTLLPEATTAITDELRWMREQGYRWPGAIMVKEDPGGSRQTDREPCPDLPKFKGSHLRIGAVAGRMPCTLRHEEMHEVRSQLLVPVLKKVEEIYNQAMEVDSGQSFNDEFYMKKFLHAGHPMQNANEFFASAAHVFTHHADDVARLIQDPNTPLSVSAYAISMWRLLRSDVFHGKVFTRGGIDPFR